MKIYGVVGAGGFGREVMPLVYEMLAMSCGYAPDGEVVFVVDKPVLPEINGRRVLSVVEFLNFPGDRCFTVAIADSASRERIARRLEFGGAVPFTVRALNSVVLSTNEIAEGAILCPFTTITSNVRIGRYFQANLYAYVAHDCVIGDFVTFAPHVHCNGRVCIEDYAYIGTGAIIRQGSDEKPIVIGRGAVVGMGAVVTKSVQAGVTVVGNPARVMERR